MSLFKYQFSSFLSQQASVSFYFSSESQIVLKQNSHFHVIYMKEKDKKVEKKRKEKSDERKTQKNIKAFYKNLACATKARCGLRPLLCVQS